MSIGAYNAAQAYTQLPSFQFGLNSGGAGHPTAGGVSGPAVIDSTQATSSSADGSSNPFAQFSRVAPSHVDYLNGHQSGGFQMIM